MGMYVHWNSKNITLIFSGSVNN